MLTIDEDVILGDVVVAAVTEHGPEAALARIAAADKEVAEHRVAPIAVIEVDGRRAVSHRAADVTPQVVPDHIAATGRITALIKRTRVVARVAHIVDHVVFEDVVVAADADGHVRRVVQQVVRSAVADTAERDAAGIAELMLGEPPDVIVHGLMAGWRERLAVAPLQYESAGAGIVNVAALDAMARTARHADANLARVADDTGFDAIAAASDHREAVAETRLQNEAAQRHVRGVLQRHERRIQRGEHDVRLSSWRVARSRAAPQSDLRNTRRAGRVPPAGSMRDSGAARGCLD